MELTSYDKFIQVFFIPPEMEGTVLKGRKGQNDKKEWMVVLAGQRDKKVDREKVDLDVVVEDVVEEVGVVEDEEVVLERGSLNVIVGVIEREFSCFPYFL